MSPSKRSNLERKMGSKTVAKREQDVDRAGFEPAASAFFECYAKAASALISLCFGGFIHAKLNYRPSMPLIVALILTF